MRRNPTARRIATLSLGKGAPKFALAHPPARPLGAKLELTFACNLRCGFCYTDSPRHTLAKTPELDEDAWRRLAEEVIELGVLEAVVTGGEPLLRRDLTLEVLERLDEAGVATYLNTNGWFVDDDVADRLATLSGLHVFVSIDGATASRHDAARGVPGSWRRAVDATGRLLDRGVATRAVHVVTPDNRLELPEALDLFWALGVASVHLAPVAPIGAAARSGDWNLDLSEVGAVMAGARDRFGEEMGIELRGGETDSFDPLATAPATFLVRPDGVVRIASSIPFSFGHVDDGGLAACWDRIRVGWDGPDVKRWLKAVHRRSRMAESGLVPYLDADEPAGNTPGGETPGGRAAPRPAISVTRRPEHTTFEEALEHVRRLALGRRYRLGPVRRTEGNPGEWFARHLGTGVVTRLNASATTVMAACSGGTCGDAFEALRERHPELPPRRLEEDVLRAVRMLLARGLVLPAGARGVAASGEPAPAAALTV